MVARLSVASDSLPVPHTRLQGQRITKAEPFKFSTPEHAARSGTQLTSEERAFLEAQKRAWKRHEVRTLLGVCLGAVLWLEQERGAGGGRVYARDSTVQSAAVASPGNEWGH